MNLSLFFIFLKVDIVLKTKVNDYQLFFKQNIVIKTMLNNFYFLFNDYLPNLSFKYLKNETNQIMNDLIRSTRD